MTYRIEFTERARIRAEEDSSAEQVEEAVRKDIDELLDDAIDSVGDLFFHCVECGSQEYVCVPVADDALRVDLCEREEGPTVKRGPLAGERLLIPNVDFDRREDG